MTAARSHRRSGITLTEILIAILIMGVGLISLATLFPLGLIRLREATRQGRAGTTFESAADDIDARALLYKPSFHNTWYGFRDPFVQDSFPDGTYAVVSGNAVVGSGVIASGSVTLPANNVGLTSGLPICYDPLWRSLTGIVPILPFPPSTTNPPGTPQPAGTTYFDQTLDIKNSYVVNFENPTIGEARFGAGVFGFGTAPVYPYLRDDPTNPSGTSIVPSAHGLQRVTNFIPWSSLGLTPQYGFTSTNLALAANLQPADVSGNVFTSIDDIVFNSTDGQVKVLDSTGNIISSASPLLPDMSSGGPQADYRFTWFFTGRQTDANGNGGQFTGEIVVCDGRPFGFDPLPGQTNAFTPAGETVVEAVYGYRGNPKAVQLRWKNTLADPPLRAGGWIADTTYERYSVTYQSRVLNSSSSFARCNWYQIAKRIDPTDDLDFPGYRSTVVTLTSPVRATTSLGSTGLPIHVNVALIMPSVINVFPRAFEVH